MKNFSTSSYSNEHAAAMRRAAELTRTDPLALLTDGQWFAYGSKDTVFYVAFSRTPVDSFILTQTVADLIALAPQLTMAYRGARPGEPLSALEVAEITSIAEVDSFDCMPDRVLTNGGEAFARDDLPLFRVNIYNRRGGADEAGRAAMIHVRASHALLEGSDSALLTRSRNAGHGINAVKGQPLGIVDFLTSRILGSVVAVAMLIAGNLTGGKEKPWGFRTLAFERQRLRRLSNRLGVRQRSLYFALVTHALNGSGPVRNFPKPTIRVLNTMLDSEARVTDDDFFRVRLVIDKLPYDEDFITFVRAVDKAVGEVDTGRLDKFAQFAARGIRILRSISRVMPWLFGPRFWRMGLAVDIGLTVVPPHHTSGALTRDMVEPIFCGAWHPGTNGVTFCPSRHFLTMSFSMEQRLIAQVDRIPELLDEIERMQIDTPVKREIPADAEA